MTNNQILDAQYRQEFRERMAKWRVLNQYQPTPYTTEDEQEPANDKE